MHDDPLQLHTHTHTSGSNKKYITIVSSLGYVPYHAVVRIYVYETLKFLLLCMDVHKK